MEKIKVIVVDDFVADRRQLRLMLEHITDLNITVVGEAENGEDALELALANQVDIVFTDIEMPVCDGFQLAVELRKRLPQTKVIFFSLYDAFEYARRALYFGGYGYLLKPIDPHELETCIKTVLGVIYNEERERRKEAETAEILAMHRQLMPVLKDNLLRNVLLGYSPGESFRVWDELAYLGIRLERGWFSLALVEIDDFDLITGYDNLDKRRIVGVKIRRYIQADLDNDHNTSLNIHLIPIDDSHYGILFNDASGTPDDLHHAMLRNCARLLSVFQKTDASITISISDVCDSIEQVRGLFQQCNYQMKYKFMLGKGVIIQAGDIQPGKIPPDLDFNNVLKDIRFLVNALTPAEIQRYITDYFAVVLPTANETQLRTLCLYILICVKTVIEENKESFSSVLGSEERIWEKLHGVETIAEAMEWIKFVLIECNIYIAQKSQSKNAKLVEKVKVFIEENYTSDINLDNLAASLYYSANYINRVFKQITGETIFNYTLAFRMEKAKKMLKDPGIKLSGVSEALGYSNPSYFGMIFKKATGLTPKEYRIRYG